MQPLPGVTHSVFATSVAFGHGRRQSRFPTDSPIDRTWPSPGFRRIGKDLQLFPRTNRKISIDENSENWRPKALVATRTRRWTCFAHPAREAERRVSVPEGWR